MSRTLAEIVESMGPLGLTDDDLDAETNRLRTMNEAQRQRLLGRLDAEIEAAERAGATVSVLKTLAGIALRLVA